MTQKGILAPHGRDDPVAFQRNTALLQQELAKAKPHLESVASLMHRTFTVRRQNVESVAKIVEMCPFLSKAIYVSMHICILL